MTTYQRLGGYIRPVDVRNRGLKVHLSQGICNAKYFQNPKQVADNPETHKVVRTGQFAYNRATTRNGEKISIALREGPDCTVSSAYQVFEVVDENLLNPKYLMMWFKRPEFDRLAIYYSHGSAHEFFEWEAMCDVMLPIPSITRQREIVSEYETLTNRIRLNNQMIQHLEATAQAFYRKTFVDNIDKENLPEGWRMGTLGEVCSKIGSGATPKGGKDSYGHTGVSLIRSMNVFDMNFCYEELAHISNKQATLLDGVTVMKKDILLNITGASVARCCMVPQDVLPARVNQHVMIIRSKEDIMQYFILCVLCSDDAKRALLGMSQSGSTREAITKSEIESFEIMIPSKDILNDFMNKIDPIFSHVSLLKQENLNLTELQSLLLSKMGQ